MRGWRIRWPFYTACGAIAALISLLFTVGSWPWPVQLGAGVALYAQAFLIERLMSARRKWSHGWLQGYFAAMEDLAPDEAERP